ncbi:MAG: hypothetical protein ABIO44_10220 [Saprospiraceae bacterium]
MDKVNFNEIRNRIGTFLDKAMTQEEEKVFLSHIDQNPIYSKEFEQQQLIRSKIKENFQRPNLAPGLHDKIRDSIRGK